MIASRNARARTSFRQAATEQVEVRDREASHPGPFRLGFVFFLLLFAVTWLLLLGAHFQTDG